MGRELAPAVSKVARIVRHPRSRRNAVCFALIVNLIIVPGADQLALQVPPIASSSFDGFVAPLRAIPVVWKRIFQFEPQGAKQETMADRAARIWQIRSSPPKVAGYVGDRVTFTALATDGQEQVVHGVKFEWSSSDAKKLEIDDAGGAKLLAPGLVTVTCQAGAVTATSVVLIRPGARRVQTDAEWKADQASVSSSGVGMVLNNRSGALVGMSGDSAATDSSLNSKGLKVGKGTWPRGFSSENSGIRQPSRPETIPGRLPALVSTDRRTSPGRRAVLTKPGTARWSTKPGSVPALTKPGPVSALAKPAPAAYFQGGSGNDIPAAAAIDDVGSPPHAIREPSRLGPIKPRYNFELGIPVVSLGGRGLGASAALFYNSSVWGGRFDISQNSNVMTFDPIQSWPSAGFSLGFGRIVYYDWQADLTYSYMLIDADGTRHALGRGHQSNQNTLRALDGSNVTFVGAATTGGTLYSSDGTKATIGVVNNRLLPTQITETNGNYIQVAYKLSSMGFAPMAIDYITDTKGRVIQFNYGAWPAPATALTSIATPVGNTTLTYTTVTLNTNFMNPVENAPSSFSAVATVTVPNRPTYNFTYSGYGMIYQIAFSGGGANGSVNYNYPTGGEWLYTSPQFSQRTESPSSTFTYDTFGTTVTRPDGSKLILGSGWTIKNSAGVTLASVGYGYGTDPGGASQVTSMLTTDDLGQQTKTEYEYDAYGNVVNRREYGFKVGSLWVVRRRTHFTYVTIQQYLDAYIRNKVSRVEVFDALQDTTDANDVLVGKTEYQYDNYLAMGGMEGYSGSPEPPGHLASFNTSYTLRGNATGVTKWSDLSGGGTSTTHNMKLDKFGNTTKAEVSCCNQKSMTYTQNTYYSQPEQVTSGDPLGLSLSESATYNFNNGTEATQTNPQGLVSSFTYDGFGNPAAYTLPTGANGSASYNIWGLGTGSSFTYNDGGTNKTLVTSVVYDGWGQVIQTIDTNGAQVNIAYDAMGRVASRTNPYPAGGTPGPLTTYQYDVLGRVTQVTLPDNNTVKTTYSGATVTVIDQVNRKIKREGDGLGRLVKVTEQDAAGNLTQDTLYTYDIADRLIQVNQGGQYRYFKYDAEGRLLFEKIPEQTATINDGTGTLWTCKYTYTSFGAVATKTDARGVITTYGYDSLNRATSITYNTSGAPGVVGTNNVTYAYDTSSSSPTRGLLLSITMTGPDPAYTETFSYDSQKRVSSRTWTRDGRSYTIGYQYNTANQLTQLTYPSGRVVGYGHDAKGRISSVGSFLTSVTYNGIGQITGTTLGNGVTESFAYDSQRMMLATQTATKSGNTLMNLTYGYQAAAGQMGPGTTAGNAAQLMSITGTINGSPESAGYTYDLWRRLATSSQMTNNVSAQRRFAYDRWGNRTGTWDAVTGGNQIQSVALQQSGATPTNQIASVTAGTTANYSYDYDGSVTGDGAHTYSYDAQNRLILVDGGSSWYKYDYANRRIKKVSGGANIHYVWEGSKLIAEYDATTGALLAEYVAGGGLAKIEAGVTRYFLSDRLSTRLVLDSTGNVLGRQSHLPYGEEIAGTGNQDKQHFTNYERDSESGTDYAVNRTHAYSLGRFQSADPYRPSGYITDPRRWNRYSYARNDPVNRIDRLGLDDEYVIPRTFEVTVKAGSDPTVTVAGGDFVIVDGDESESGGGGGGGGQSERPQTPPAQSNYQNIRDSAKSILNDPNNPCTQALASLPGQIVDKLKAAVDATNFYDLDATLSNGEKFGEQHAFWYVGVQAKDVQETLNQWFDRNFPFPPGTSGALTDRPDQAPYPGIYFHGSTTNLANDPALLMHELLHTFVGNEQQVAQVLNIDTTGKTREQISVAIKDWMVDHGCKK